jgi:hypothetical protein
MAQSCKEVVVIRRIMQRLRYWLWPKRVVHNTWGSTVIPAGEREAPF